MPIKLLRKAKKVRTNTCLLISGIKYTSMHEAISNATQLGVNTIQPIISRRSSNKNIKIDKLQLIARQACAQCNRIDLPQINQTIKLKTVVDELNSKNIPILWASEICAREKNNAFCESVKTVQKFFAMKDKTGNLQNLAILIGAEGGFDKEEVQFLLGKKM